MENEQPKKMLFVPQNVRLYIKDDKALQIRQNKLLYWQNILTIALGVAQISVAVILALKFF